MHNIILPLLLATLSLNFSAAGAHPGMNTHLEHLEARIARQPEEVELYIERAELHRRHRNWRAALHNYRRAAQLAPDHPQLDFYLGRLWLEAGKPTRAFPLIERYLRANPEHGGALLVRARVATALGNPLTAAKYLEKAISNLERPTPGLYLEWAKLLVNEGGVQVDRGLATIDQGISRLGPVVTLVQYAVEVESARGNYSAALARIDTLPETIRTLPLWLFRHGDILQAAGRTTEATTRYREALRTINRLPPQRRQVRAVMALKSQLDDRLR